MANPLEGGSHGDGGGPLKPGESRTVHGHDKQGNIVKTITILRTERDYVYDLCDAYNRALPDHLAKRGLEWFVLPSGELKLGESVEGMRANTKRIEQRKQTESAIALRRDFENAREAAE